jgi:hypothetical protein
MDERGTERQEREAAGPRLTVERTASRGSRLRVLSVVAVAFAIIAAGVYGRLDGRRDTPAVPAVPAIAAVVPVATTPAALTLTPEPSGGEDAMRRPRRATAAPAAPATGGAMTLGEDGLIGGALPGSPGTRRPSDAGPVGTVCAVMRIEPDVTVIGRVDRGLDGVYQGSIPVRAPRRTVTATLELFLGQSPSAFQGRSKVGQASLARFAVRVDARPFPPGTLRVLSGTIAPHPDAPSSSPLIRSGARVIGTLMSDGYTVDLSVVIAPLPGLAERTSGTVEVHTAFAAVPSIAC